MSSTTSKGVSGGAEAGEQSPQNREGQVGEERRQGPGVQVWPDGSTYEGEFMNGFKHGRGKFTWTSGEYYEGSFYKDYRHGDGLFCWPTGHKFIGKFYLNRKEGYGQHLFPDGASFQGLYHADQRFGPGVVSYSDGRQDVGLWLGQRLLRLCTAVDEAFTLENFPEYAPYMDPAATTDCLTQPPDLSGLARTRSEAHTDRDLLSDEKYIYPADMESYSTDGDHLPLPPGRRSELDQHFYGEQWEPGADLHQGYERDPLFNLPLQARMQAHLYNHRRQAENVGWDVAAVLSLDRDGFGPKGPLEVDSEQFICHAGRGEVQAVRQILKTGLVHPDVADSQGHTALIAATVHCHNDLIQLLLDMGADIDKLNHEGMSALAVCHVLYYPFCSLDTTLAKPPAKTQALLSLSACGNSPQISQVDSNTNTTESYNRPQTSTTSLSDQSLISDQAADEQTEHKSDHAGKTCNDSDLATESRPAPEETEEGGELQMSEERRHKDDGGGSKRKGRGVVEEQDQTWESESCVKHFVESRNGAVESDDCESVRHVLKKDREERKSVHRSIQVLDGHIALGSVQWRERWVSAAAVIQQDKDKDKDLTKKQSFDSACALSSYSIHVTEEAMQRSAEALSRTGLLRFSNTQETVRKMAAMKTEHRGYLNTLELLLNRGADPNVSKVPMPVLFLAIMAADTEAVKRLLLCGAHTDIPLPPERKGLYPLHVAAALPGSAGCMITELLLHAVTDPDLQACDQDEIYEPDRAFMKSQKPPSVKQGGSTPLHVACQRDRGYQNASTVVALLLSHSARTDLIWSGHSPLSLAIASGNELAVEELLKRGADPNIPLGRGVGSALCTVTNFSYPLDGKRPNLLDMVVKAGADALMPVMVGDFMGTAVDYAHASFYQDLRIANTPFHALNVQERETFIARRQLLSTMGDLLRETVIKREAEALERERQLLLDGGADPSRLHLMGKHKKSSFKFCYHCGLSAAMKLTACTRCNKVYFCSTDCKLRAWDERHKEECVRVSASAKKRNNTDPGTAEADGAETDVENQVNPKENYSCN
ncbi:ankyrin repeat and MYND domain-containing protein 1 isoform X1 [Solea solea]|uniref:ankyrin repeat and MYND domain-containing protein 1 isoform X1 n=1 Tax=Solea solea TaxID=90069 RepID=UPI00272BB94F|nr:ankyrin repeat and MYND domain-containing protein 1 isoform X1 [Solea solea]